MSLIAYYPFKNGSLENIVGTEVATNTDAIYTKSLGKESFYFNGSTSYISGPFTNTVTTELSMFAWVYLNAYTSDRSCILINSAYLTVNSNGNVSIYNYGKSPSGYHDSNMILELNKWYYIGVTWNTTEAKIFINGLLDKTIACTGSPTIGSAIKVGNESGNSRILKGYISDVRIYNHTLSLTEITQLYTASNPQTKTDLIAHYPLNGDTSDYSGYGNDAINNGATIDNNGKIGKCYSFTQTGSDGINIPQTNFTELQNNYSMSVWVYPVGTHYHYNGTFISSGNWNTSCWAFGVSQDNTQIDVLGRGHSKWVTYTLQLNKWTNLICTVSNGKSKLYANGVYIGEANVTTSLISDATNTCIGRETYLGGYFSFNGKINDLRIYNGVLSTKEIKEISKAKILHYNFNDFQEPTTNLDLLTNSNYYGRSNSYGSYCTITNGYYYGKDCYKIVFNLPNGTNLAAWTGAYFNLTTSNLSSLGFVNNDYVTRSFDVYIESMNDSGNPPRLSIEGTSINKTYNNIDKSLIGVWQRVSCNSQIVDITQTNNYLFYIHSNGAGLTTYDSVFTIYMCNAQLEKKDHATPYTLTSRSGKVNDSSGYNNHSTLSLATTPKYTIGKLGSGGYWWIDSTKLIQTTLNKPTDTVTMNCWFKSNTSGSSGYHIPMNIDSSYYEMSISSSGKIRVGFNLSGTRYVYDYGSGILDGNWHMLTSSYDGTYIKGYIDGVEVGSTNIVGTLSSGVGTFRIGNYDGSSTYGNINAWEDDVRVYATALSLDSIKELYQVGQTIHNNGILETNQFIENGFGHTLTNYNTWIVGQVATGWSNNGVATNNSRVLYTNPMCDLDIIWKGDSDGLSDRGNCGYQSPLYPIDPTKKYRFSVWIKREMMQSSPTPGIIYHGVYGYDDSTNIGVYTLTGTISNTNPYFTAYNSITDNNVWRLWVGYVLPHNTIMTTNDITNGIYNVNGTKFGGCTDFKWLPNTTRACIRDYLYYSADPNELVYFYRPRIDLCDGSEPSLQELLRCQDHMPYPNIDPLFNANHTIDINEIREAFTPGITFIKDDDNITQKLICDYLEGEVYAKTESDSYVVNGVTFSTVYQKINPSEYSSKVVMNMSKDILYINKMIEN